MRYYWLCFTWWVERQWSKIRPLTRDEKYNLAMEDCRKFWEWYLSLDPELIRAVEGDDYTRLNNAISHFAVGYSLSKNPTVSAEIAKKALYK